ncbi:GGDEF domain-containing protein [Neptuniibacter sp.]|uniref:GGDEF domain-containing protein n=1 Tax=Neptuniibacter sp. TaxID=1962643 RepID=UPI00261EB121|nr:GGDEF domain-containing protein [Neptuniibacter sp.]MCP4595389.1 GGDEF domain-containing protein [Neptuniibacter sp.]
MHRAHQTLLEQMKISDAEIHNRLELSALTPIHFEHLKNALPIIEEQLETLVDQFYVSQLTIDDISVLISDADTLNRLKAAQHNYILDLFSGKYDGEYVNNRLRIGMVHKRIGVEPKLYLSAISSLKRILFDALAQGINDSNTLSDTKDALDKLLYFDTTLVFDTYIDSLLSELALANKKTEKYANSLEEKVAERTIQLEELAQQDPLTGLKNQRFLRQIANQQIASVKRRETFLSLIYIDVDNFKQINDKMGHLHGDEVLKGVSVSINQCIREADTACRYGGDEFCILLPDTNIDAARIVGQRMIDCFSNCYPEYHLSMGIAETGADQYIELDQLISDADKKMYNAKGIEGSFIEV